MNMPEEETIGITRILILDLFSKYLMHSRFTTIKAMNKMKDVFVFR